MVTGFELQFVSISWSDKEMFAPDISAVSLHLLSRLTLPYLIVLFWRASMELGEL